MLRDELAHAFKGRPAGTIDEALADPAVGAVAVRLPHALEALVALRALGAGKHVLCEKPLATSLEQADLMIAGAAAAGRTLTVAENVWFEPPLMKLRELVAAGVIGPVSLVQIARDAWLDDCDLDERPWFRSGHKAAGGIMMSGGIHDIEMARMLAGEISAILAVRGPQRSLTMEGDDTSIVVIRFESGAIGTLTELFGHHSCDGFPPRITPRPAGRRQWKLGLEGGAITLAAVTGNRREAARTESIGVIESQDSFLAEVEHFLVSIRNDQEPLTSGRAQQRALELVPAAYASMNDGGTWCG